MRACVTATTLSASRQIREQLAGPCHSFSFSFSSRWHRSARKGPYALRPVSQQSPQGCPQNSANVCLDEHRSFSTFEGGMSNASFLHSSFLKEINAVMLWPVHVEKVPQSSEHLCPAKLQTRPGGRMHSGTRWKDSYIGHPLLFLWHEGSPTETGYFPQYKKKLSWIPVQKQDLASAMGIMRKARDVDQYPHVTVSGDIRNSLATP